MVACPCLSFKALLMQLQKLLEEFLLLTPGTILNGCTEFLPQPWFLGQGRKIEPP